MKLTTSEAAAILDLDPGRIRKDVEYGVVDCESPPRFALPALVYFRAAADIELGVDGRRTMYEYIERALAAGSPPAQLRLSRFLELDLREVVREVKTRLDRFDAWKTKLVTRDDVLGGEPAFPRSRLAVRQIGEMILRGAPLAEIREDYPYLKDEDLEFAKLFVTAYPRKGRPRGSEVLDR